MKIASTEAQAVDRADQQHAEQDRPDRRQRDVALDLPPARAIEARRVQAVLGGTALSPARQTRNTSGVHCQTSAAITAPSASVGSVSQACAAKPDEAEQVVEHAELGVEDPAPDQAHDDRRHHHGQEQQVAHQGLALEPGVEQEGDGDAQRELDPDAAEHVERRHAQRAPDIGVAEEAK